VVAGSGKELLQNRGGEGDVRRYLKWKEEARGQLSPERSHDGAEIRRRGKSSNTVARGDSMDGVGLRSTRT
jgi:hypothetical protein